MTPVTVLEHEGVEQSITEWALDYGITPGIIMARLERGQSTADAITTPMKVGHRGQRLPVVRCKQVLPKKQTSPRRARKDAKTYCHDGKALTINEWSDLTGLKIVTIRARLRSGWDIAKALTAPADRAVSRPKPMSRAELAREGGVEPRTVESRLRRGWPLELALIEPPGARMGRFAHGRPGVSSDFAPSKGTGAGTTLQETPNITFSGIDA